MRRCREVGGARRVGVDGDVAVGHVGGELAQAKEEPRRSEVPDAVVADGVVEHDLLEASAALEGELDLDRGPLRGEEDGVDEMVAEAGLRPRLLGKEALAAPLSEAELVLDEEADVGDGLDVRNEAVVGLPSAEARAGDARAATCQPDERRQINGEAGRAGPAGRAPAVAESAGGPVAAPDQDGELVECDRVLLPDEAEQLPVTLGDLVAAPVPPCSPGWSLFGVDRVRLFLQLDHFLPLYCCSLVVLLVLVCAPAPDAQPRMNRREREHVQLRKLGRTAGQPEPAVCPAARRTIPSYKTGSETARNETWRRPPWRPRARGFPL